MISVEDREEIRRAYFIENKSLRQIARELGHSRETVRKAIESAEPTAYTLKRPRSSPVLGPYKARIDELLAQSEHLPRKQRFTGRKIYELIKAEGYTGSEPTVRRYIAQRRREKKKRQVYIPLEFDPGTDAQVDWGEAVAIIGGERVKVQLFVMRLCYSRKLFVKAFPAQKQEAFFDGHVAAFHHFQGVPHRISYDNLKIAVQRILQGHKRQEQQAFIVFRSHYLFESHFCTPGQGHEKGRVEDGVGFVRRNFLVPIPQVDSFEELNTHLLNACLADDRRRIARQPLTIAQAWEQEKPYLLPLPARDFDCCVRRTVTLNPYSQVEFESNRYSVPTDGAYQNLVLKAYPFRVDILYLDEVIASHPRCYGRQQDILDPLHYLPLLEQRPGAFAHARPIRRWRQEWPEVYERLLAQLQAKWPEGRGVREFIRILKLHGRYPAALVTQAVEQALQYGCAHADGVELCLRQLLNPGSPASPLDLSPWPQLMGVGEQAPDLHCYDQLLGRT
ncbi:MAG: IS21 family transposase [Anaerolineae bacterium]|nr:IS21 family transposase [Anaerolineae bacterium]